MARQDNNKLVKFSLHGNIWGDIAKNWEFKAKSLSKCLQLLELNSKNFYKTLWENDKKNIKYEVIINGRKFQSNKELKTLEDIKNSELAMNYKNLETVDIVPIIEGADSDIFQAILGAVLIVIGAILYAPTGGASGFLIGAGLTLLASGAVGLLTKPPKFEDFREIDQGGKTSYLFAGPQNIIGEGGPVPVGYGNLMVGSQVVSAAYVIRDFSTSNTNLILRDEYGNLQKLLK